MNCRIQNRVARTLLPMLVLLAALAAPAWAVDDGYPPVETPATGSVGLKYLPKDYWLAGEIDMRMAALVLSSPETAKNPQFATFMQALTMIKMFTGIDVLTDVDTITFFASGHPDDEKPKFLVAVKGTFDNDKVEDSLRTAVAKDAKESQYKGKTLFVSPNGGFYSPEASTLLFGDPDLLKQSVDGLKDGEKPLPPGLKSVLDRTNNKLFVWAAVKAEPLLGSEALSEWSHQNAELTAALKKIDCLSFSFAFAPDGMVVNALSIVTPGSDAKALYEFLKQRKSDMLNKEGTNVLFASLLILADVKTSGPYVNGSFRITAKAFMELWQTKLIVKP